MSRILVAIASLAVAVQAPAAKTHQTPQTYRSAEEALQALYAAVQAADDRSISRVLGGDGEILSSGDEGQDDLDRRRFLEKYREMHRLVREPGGTIAYIGAENWPFPIPLTAGNGGWFFDTAGGVREILVRRIGANESFAIDICRALRPDERTAVGLAGNRLPVHGYYFRARPGLATTSFFIAYPAEYRSSGVMTFIVGHDGVVFERDLGPRTARLATAMTRYQPDAGWHALSVDDPPPPSADPGQPTGAATGR